jgi:hypothetical protein
MVSGVATRNGKDGQASCAESQTARIASGGLSTTREGKQLVAAACADALNERIPDRKAMIAIRTVDSLVRTTKFEHTHGDKAPIQLVDPIVIDPMESRRQALLEELAAIEAVRAAG